MIGGAGEGMTTQTGADPLDTMGSALDPLVGYHLRRANGAFSAHFARALAGTGMRQVLFGILSVVERHPGINQGAAGRVLGIQRANMVSLINELVDAGWIERQPADDDRRAFALAMTPGGRVALARTLELVHAHEEQMLAGLSEAERLTLVDLLGRIERLAE